MSLNNISIIGRLTADPVYKELADGKSVCNMRIASGNDDRTVFIDVAAWGKQAKPCSQYLIKGRQVGVCGRLDYREYQDKEGNNRSTYSINANSVEFLGSKRETNDTPDGGETHDA